MAKAPAKKAAAAPTCHVRQVKAGWMVVEQRDGRWVDIRAVAEKPAGAAVVKP